MKTKFDESVAHEIPVTKSSTEPELPWKLPDSEMEKIEAADEIHKSVVASPPLQVRAIFVILLIVTIFVIVLNGIVNVSIDNSQMQINMLKKDAQVSSVKNALEKIAGEKKTLSEDKVKLEKQVNDLNAQKELYGAVIETLTKKTDDAQAAD